VVVAGRACGLLSHADGHHQLLIMMIGRRPLLARCLVRGCVGIRARAARAKERALAFLSRGIGAVGALWRMPRLAWASCCTVVLQEPVDVYAFCKAQTARRGETVLQRGVKTGKLNVVPAPKHKTMLRRVAPPAGHRERVCVCVCVCRTQRAKRKALGLYVSRDVTQTWICVRVCVCECAQVHLCQCVLWRLDVGHGCVQVCVCVCEWCAG
jgi:hypothetical protein